MPMSAKPVPSGAWNSSAACASSIRISACDGPRPPARLSALLGHRLVKRRHPASGLLQLRPESLERGAIVPSKRCEPFQYLRCERGAWIGSGPLDEIVQRVANLLGIGNSRADRIV